MSIRTRSLVVLAVLALLPATLAAQWINYPTPGIPRLPDGKPNLSAPAPRTADGKPDLSGIWVTSRGVNAVLSIALYPKWVTLFFLQNGPKLPDPGRLLKGQETRVRSIVLEPAAPIDTPAVRAVIRAAVARAAAPIDPSGRRRMVIKSISAKQRPRRPAHAPPRRTKSA